MSETPPTLDPRSQFLLEWLRFAKPLRERTPNDRFVVNGRLHQPDGTGDDIKDRQEVLSILDNGALGLFDVFQRHPTPICNSCQYEVACHLQGVARKLCEAGFDNKRAYAITGSMIHAAMRACNEIMPDVCFVSGDALTTDTSRPPQGYRR